MRATAAVIAVAFGCTAYLYLTVPDVRPLRAENPGTTAFIELRAREARARGVELRRVQRWVPYGSISPHLIGAVVTAEDAAFWQHDGIDLRQIRESLEVNIQRRELARGGSTITQQLAKNLYLSPSKDPVRKLREVWIARRLEAELPKRRILELYLNVIEWGDGIYGAEAAARTYFGTSAAALGPQESALLAAAIISPRVLNPGRPSARLEQRQQMLLRRMGQVPGRSPAVTSKVPAVAAESSAPAMPAPVPELPAESLPVESPRRTAEPCPVPPCV